MVEDQDEEGFSLIDFHWSYQANFPLHPFGEKSDWVSWIQNERQLWLEALDYDRCASIESWWLKTPEQEPIILVEKEREQQISYEIWDGFHRVGLSCLHDQLTCPAFVGKLKNKGES